MTGSREGLRGRRRTLSAAAFAPLALGPFWKPPSHCGERGASAGGRSGETRGGVVSGEALGSGVEGRWTIVASRIRTITKMEGRRTRCGSPAGAKGQVGERARRSVGHGTCRIGMGVEEKIALSGRPGFRRRARTRRASGRAKRGITRAPREKESAPLVSIGSRTSGTVRTRHADYVSRGVCFSRGRLSADPGIKISRHSRRMRGARGVPRANQGRGHGRNGSIADRKTRRSRTLYLRKAARRGAVRLGWSLLVLSPGAFSHSRPRTKTRARLVSDRPSMRKISADDGRRRRPSLTPTRADLDPIVEFHPNARVAF